MKRKVCLITPNHISTNPRLVKEAKALANAGYSVHVIFTVSDRQGHEPDNQILRENPNWTFDFLDWSGRTLRSSGIRFLSGLRRKTAAYFFRFFRSSSFATIIVNRHYRWQLKKAVSANADLYIGHNLGALPVARAAAKRREAKFGFDAEDFHRNEMSDNVDDPDVIIKANVEAQCLPDVNHFTAASPLIGAAYTEIFPSLSPTIILNVFPRVSPKTENLRSANGNIRLFWFSQTVGENRGIEPILSAMGRTRERNFELHLLGNCQQDFRKKLQQLSAGLGLEKELFFYEPVPEHQIFELGAQFDIGMAAEIGAPRNRDICLTNKIFTYIQCGLAVLATDTTAQVEFLRCYQHMGKVYKKGDAVSLSEMLDYYNNNRMELERCKKTNFELGQQSLNWESEKDKFLTCVSAQWN